MIQPPGDVGQPPPEYLSGQIEKSQLDGAAGRVHQPPVDQRRQFVRKLQRLGKGRRPKLQQVWHEHFGDVVDDRGRGLTGHVTPSQRLAIANVFRVGYLGGQLDDDGVGGVAGGGGVLETKT